MVSTMTSFGTHLRTWRGTRHMSQLQLASEADVSSRHISFLESGRASPSRAMILRLCDVLDIPTNQRNVLLESAGFAPQHHRSELTEEHMQSVVGAMRLMLDKHNPYPAVVMDRLWRLVDLNDTAAKLFGAAGLAKGDSLLAWVSHTKMAPQVIENWAEVGHHTMIRIRAESRAQGGVAELDRAADHLSRDPDIQAFVPEPSLSPVIRTIYRAGPMRLAMISTYASFGGAEDLTIADLKIELMFPATPEAVSYTHLTLPTILRV